MTEQHEDDNWNGIGHDKGIWYAWWWEWWRRMNITKLMHKWMDKMMMNIGTEMDMRDEYGMHDDEDMISG